SSLLINKEFVSEIPNWAYRAKHGDFALALLLSARGKVHFVDKNMSSHRMGVPNSVMTKINENSTKKRKVEYLEHRKSILMEANKYYQFKFDNQLKDNIESCEVSIILNKKGLLGLVEKSVIKQISQKGILK